MSFELDKNETLEKLKFLIEDYGFELISDGSEGYDLRLIYSNKIRTIWVCFEHLTVFFTIELVEKSDINDSKQIYFPDAIPIMYFLHHFAIKDIIFKDISTNHNPDTQAAIDLQIKLLREYGRPILMGEEWFDLET